MKEVVRIIQDKDKYRVYINMQHQTNDQGSVLDFIRLFPHGSRKYHSTFRYWSIASYETSVLIAFLIKNNISHSIKGTIKIDPMQQPFHSNIFQRMGICHNCKKYGGISPKTGLCPQCS